MDSINVTVPAALAEQKSTLAKALAEITSKESELTKQRTAIKTTLDRIDAAIAMLMGQTPIKFAASTTRKPMSEESRKKLSEALKRAAASKKAQKMTTETPAAATDTTAKAPEVANPSGLTPAPIADPPKITMLMQSSMSRRMKRGSEPTPLSFSRKLPS